MKILRTPFLLFVLPALAVAGAPTFFVYERAAILRGEWWRLWTGHWVHFSVSHAGWNLFALAVAAALLERLQPGWTLRFVALAAPAISLGLLALTPTMTTYGGLSGLAGGVVTLLALAQLDAPARYARAWWFGALALIVGKIAWESVAGTPLFSRLEPGAYRVSVAAHALGFAAALAFFLFARRRYGRDGGANTPRPTSQVCAAASAKSVSGTLTHASGNAPVATAHAL
ncbi:MAG: rhombosortase [Opitutae bacterium]|nr:rhombosortase [Opitutae bacterium]